MRRKILIAAGLLVVAFPYAYANLANYWDLPLPRIAPAESILDGLRRNRAARRAMDPVAAGVNFFRRGQYNKSAQAFAEAEVLCPDTPEILYDRGCAESRLSITAHQPAEMFRAATHSDRKDVAAVAHFNLGCLLANRARTELGPYPERLPPPAQKKTRETLATAIAHFRDSLVVDPQFHDARFNIELIRVWLNHMDELWAPDDDADGVNQNEPLALILADLDRQQHDVFVLTHQLAEKTVPAGGASFREAVEDQSSVRRSLFDLRQIVNAANPPEIPIARIPPNLQAMYLAQNLRRLRNGLPAIKTRLDQIRPNLVQSGRHLDRRRAVAAATVQREALDSVNQMLTIAGNYPDLVIRAVGLQQNLVGRSSQAVPVPNNRLVVPTAALIERQTRVGELVAALPDAARGMRLIIAPTLKLHDDVVNLEQRHLPDAQRTKQRLHLHLEGIRDSTELALQSAAKLKRQIERATVLMHRNDPQVLAEQEKILSSLEALARTLPQTNGSKEEDSGPARGRPDVASEQLDREDGDTNSQTEFTEDESTESILEQIRGRVNSHLRHRALVQPRRPGPGDRDW